MWNVCYEDVSLGAEVHIEIQLDLKPALLKCVNLSSVIVITILIFERIDQLSSKIIIEFIFIT